MKKTILVFVMALIALTSFGQWHTVLAPQHFEATCTFDGTAIFNSAKSNTGLGFTQLVLNDTDNSIMANPIVYAQNGFVTDIQNISRHLDTITGAYLSVITTTRLDTIKLRNSVYNTGQILKVVTTLNSNDSTLFIPVSGTINGASSYWLTGTYKAVTFYYNGTNYFIIK